VLNRQTGLIPVTHGRYIADHVAGAKFVELAGNDLLFSAGDTTVMLDSIEELLTGDLPSHHVDRVLATVVFTDVVGSTEQAAGLGDRRWRELLTTHDALVSQEIERHRGRRIKSTGDGVLATFDGPGRAVRCAAAICDALRAVGIEIRGRGPHRRDRTAGGRHWRHRGSYRCKSVGACRYRRGARLENRRGPRGGFGDRVRGSRRT